MLIANTTVWQTRIQNIDALLTAGDNSRDEIYYLATVCQVGIDPPLISISPNPAYPICALIEATGIFGLNFPSKHQGQLVEQCAAMEPDTPDKLVRLGLSFETTASGTPLLTDCIQSLECQVEETLDIGDHRTFIGGVIDRRIRGQGQARELHRFRGGQSTGERLSRRLLCQTRLYDLAMALRSRRQPAVSIAEGTRTLVSETMTPLVHVSQRHQSPAYAQPVEATQLDPHRQACVAPSIPGICLVGCGSWGGVHALELKALGKRVRRFFASRDLDRARDFRRRFHGEDIFEDLAAALADPRVDAVILALPHHVHAPATCAALAAGKHVLVEKPLCLRMDEGEELVRAAAASGLCLAVAEQYRLSPLVRTVRQLIAEGSIGPVSLVNAGLVTNFRPDRNWKQIRETMGGGVLLDVGVHYINILRHWFGEPELIWSISPPHLQDRFEGEDSITTVLRFPAGPVATLSISWSGCRSPEAPNIEVIGERGSLQLWFERPYVLRTTPLASNHWSRRLRQALPWRLEKWARPWLPRASRQRIPVPGGNPIGSRALIEDFVLAITTGAEPSVSGVEGLRDLELVRAAYRAQAEGKPVMLGDPPPA